MVTRAAPTIQLLGRTRESFRNIRTSSRMESGSGPTQHTQYVLAYVFMSLTPRFRHSASRSVHGLLPHTKSPNATSLIMKFSTTMYLKSVYNWNTLLPISKANSNHSRSCVSRLRTRNHTSLRHTGLHVALDCMCLRWPAKMMRKTIISIDRTLLTMAFLLHLALSQTLHQHNKGLDGLEKEKDTVRH